MANYTDQQQWAFLPSGFCISLFIFYSLIWCYMLKCLLFITLVLWREGSSFASSLGSASFGFQIPIIRRATFTCWHGKELFCGWKLMSLVRLESWLYPNSAQICKSEGVDVTAPQLKYFINACLGDIRRTTMLLQFWYQGKQEYTGWVLWCACAVPYLQNLSPSDIL